MARGEKKICRVIVLRLKFMLNAVVSVCSTTIQVYDDTTAGEAATPQPPAASPVSDAAGSSDAAAALPLTDSGCLPFFFLDAYENPDRPGEVQGTL